MRTAFYRSVSWQAAAWFFVLICSAWAASEPVGMSGEYENRIREIDSELLECKDNLEWLNLKIKGMTHSGRPVSGILYQSVQYKTSRIESLEKEKAFCQARLSGLTPEPVPDAAPTSITATDISEPDPCKTLQSVIEKVGIEDWVVIEPDPFTRGYRLKTILPILFASGSAVLFKEYEAFLKKLARVVKDLDAQIVVDGYADTDPIHTRRFPSNFELGAIRAANVVHFLVHNGVPPGLFKIASTGRYRFPPLRMSANKTLERHVHITVLIPA